MPQPFYWSDLTSPALAARISPATIAILPVASTEQHGPHLPVSTDVSIMQGMLDEVASRMPGDIDALALPVQPVGKANEHSAGPGSLSLPAPLLIEAWTTLGEWLAKWGIRRAVIVNSHGGNTDMCSIVAREWRVRFGMAAVSTAWVRFGEPAGMLTPWESEYGLHGGDYETSLMLHFRPDLVHMDKAERFVSTAETMKLSGSMLGPKPPHALAWIAHDLNPHGVVGDASIATGERGAAFAAHQADGFIAMLRDLRDFDLGGLKPIG